jgi:hypothetical protein
MVSLCRVFSVLECPAPLFQLLDGVLREALLLQHPVEVLDVEAGEVVVADDVAERSLRGQML